MLLGLALSAAVIARIGECEAAVHGDLSKAEAACAPFGSGAVALLTMPPASEACEQALASGRIAGKIGAKLPEPIRGGYIRDFDKKLALCRAPDARNEVPVRESFKLWD